MSAALFVPDFPDGACPSCGGLLSRGGRCPACMTFAHDLRNLLHVVPAYQARPNTGGEVAYSSPACRPAFHQPLENATVAVRALAETGSAENRSYLLQIHASLLEAASACPAGEACAWGRS